MTTVLAHFLIGAEDDLNVIRTARRTLIISHLLQYSD